MVDVIETVVVVEKVVAEVGRDELLSLVLNYARCDWS